MPGPPTNGNSQRQRKVLVALMKFSSQWLFTLIHRTAFISHLGYCQRDNLLCHVKEQSKFNIIIDMESHISQTVRISFPEEYLRMGKFKRSGRNLSPRKSHFKFGLKCPFDSLSTFERFTPQPKVTLYIPAWTLP